jgi:hypothetical protein
METQNKTEEGREKIRDRLQKTELRSRKKGNGREREMEEQKSIGDRWRNGKV